MKILFILLFCLTFLSCYQTIIPTKTTHILQIKKTNIKTVFEKVKKWVAVTFKSTKAVIDYESSEENIITLSVFLKDDVVYGLRTTTGYNVKIMISMKETKIKFEVLDILINYSNSGNGDKTQLTYFLDQEAEDSYKLKIEELELSLVDFIETDGKKSEDW